MQRFFAEYLAAQRNLSPHTRLSYRTTFRLLLHFLAEQQRRSVDQLTLGTLTPESILAFLDHLERTRRNSPRTHNVRLATIRTFVRYVLGTAALEFLGSERPWSVRGTTRSNIAWGISPISSKTTFKERRFWTIWLRGRLW